MFSEITKHLAHYFSLLAIIGVSFWGLITFPYDKGMQTAIAISLGTAFVIWGLIHHWIHDDLHPKVILEYIATATLGIAILLIVIWQA
ncbi:hypothetical protein CMO96_03720 [Candidatus Woesebacteria bacterium]|nr:hypothetical protein [Candidatus Woesebacteria bacterium]|tara:strand:+ start:227 stop:490 length:264 start_codon:yes stop_codon:yes gene_type:complete